MKRLHRQMAFSRDDFGEASSVVNTLFDNMKDISQGEKDIYVESDDSKQTEENPWSKHTSNLNQFDSLQENIPQSHKTILKIFGNILKKKATQGHSNCAEHERYINDVEDLLDLKEKYEETQQELDNTEADEFDNMHNYFKQIAPKFESAYVFDTKMMEQSQFENGYRLVKLLSFKNKIVLVERITTKDKKMMLRVFLHRFNRGKGQYDSNGEQLCDIMVKDNSDSSLHWKKFWPTIIDVIQVGQSIYFLQIENPEDLQMSDLSPKGNQSVEQESDLPYYSYQVTLLKLDLVTKQITEQSQEEICLDDRLSGIMFFTPESQESDLSQTYVVIVTENRLQIRKLLDNDLHIRGLAEDLNIEVSKTKDLTSDLAAIRLNTSLESNQKVLKQLVNDPNMSFIRDKQLLIIYHKEGQQFHVYESKFKDLRDLSKSPEIQKMLQLKNERLENDDMIKSDFYFKPKDSKIAFRHGCKLLNVTKMFEKYRQDTHCVSVLINEEKGHCTMAANPVNDTRKRAQLLVTYIIEKNQQDDQLNTNELVINNVRENGSVSCHAPSVFIKWDGAVKFGANLYAQGIIKDSLLVPHVIYFENKLDENADRIHQYSMKAIKEAKNSVIVSSERKLLTWIENNQLKSTQVSDIKLSKDAGGDDIVREKAQTQTIQVLDQKSNAHALIFESENYTNPAFCLIQKNNLVAGTFISLEMKESLQSLNYFCQSSETTVQVLNLPNGKVMNIHSTLYSVAQVACQEDYMARVLDIEVKRFSKKEVSEEDQFFEVDNPAYAKHVTMRTGIKMKMLQNFKDANFQYAYRTAIVGQTTILKPKKDFYKPKIFPMFQKVADENGNTRTRIVGKRLIFDKSDYQPIVLKNQQNGSPEISGVFTYQSAHVQNDQVIIAEVKLRPNLIRLMNTEYDVFKGKQPSFVREILDMQTISILNIQIKDPFENYNSKLETHEFLQPTNIRKGFSPAEKEIEKETFEQMQAQLDQFQFKSTSQQLDILKMKAISGKISKLEKFIVTSGKQDLLSYLNQTQLLHKRTDFLYYDKNCQSQLVSKFIQCDKINDYKDFGLLLNLMSISRMIPDLKRQHITSMFKLAGHDLQKSRPERQYLFPEIVQFLDEQRGSDEDLINSNQIPIVGFRQTLEDSRLTKNARVPHFSKFIKSSALSTIMRTNYLQNAVEDVKELIVQENFLKEDDFTLKFLSKNRDYPVNQSLLDFRPLVFQSQILEIVQIDDADSLIEAQNFKFNKLTLTKTQAGLLDMCIWARVDPSQLQTIRHAITSLYNQHTKKHFQRLSWVFYFGHALPQLIQLTLGKYTFEEDWRLNTQAGFIYLLLVISTISQSILLRSEINSGRGADDWMDYFNLNNILDIVSIFYTYFYNIIRIYMPNSSFLDANNPPEGDNQSLEEVMPVIHFLMILLIANQSRPYLKLDDDRAKFMTLFTRSSYDARNFLIIYGILTGLMAILLHVLGAQMDTDNYYNFTPDAPRYDVNHGDYPLVRYWLVCIFAAFRNAVGDLNPPAYLYWMTRYEQGFYDSSMFMVGLIWSVYSVFVFFQIILGLNFLIAIVSDSYANIMDRQHESIIESQDDLNRECIQELRPDDDIDVEILVLQTAISATADSEWDGVSQTIKKDLRKLDDKIEEVSKQMEKDVDRLHEANFKLERQMIQMNAKLDKLIRTSNN